MGEAGARTAVSSETCVKLLPDLIVGRGAAESKQVRYDIFGVVRARHVLRIYGLGLRLEVIQDTLGLLKYESLDSTWRPASTIAPPLSASNSKHLVSPAEATDDPEVVDESAT